MDITGQFQQIRILLADDGFIPILEQMAMPLVPSVEINRIARQKLSHAPGKALRSCPHQQMKMILHERPGIHPKRAFLA
jgi:hypothetical protein